MRALFGEDGYYLELQDHKLPNDPAINQGLIRIHQETGIPLVVTNDAHYLRREDAEMQDTLMCIQMGKTVDDPNRLRMETSELYVKSTEEMAALFPDYPEAVENTVKIAELCNMDFRFGVHHLPEFKLPEGYTDGRLLPEAVRGGLRAPLPRRPGGVPGAAGLRDGDYPPDGVCGVLPHRLRFHWIRQEAGHPRGPRPGLGGRLHGGLLHGHHRRGPDEILLYFERFLNPERVTMPDIDIDFCIRRRQEVIEYVQNKYGRPRGPDRHLRHHGRPGAIRDVGRALNIPYADVDVVAKQVPSGPGPPHHAGRGPQAVQAPPGRL